MRRRPRGRRSRTRSRSCGAASGAAPSARSRCTRDVRSRVAARNRSSARSSLSRRPPDFKGSISDLGGPTANMYRMRCTKPEVERLCRRLSCVHPKICKLLDTDHAPTLDLMRRARAVPGVKRVHIASGIRMDLAAGEPDYLDELATHHVGGHLKVAPEHVSERVLSLLKEARRGQLRDLCRAFRGGLEASGQGAIIWCPISSPAIRGSGVEEMIELAILLEAARLSTAASAGFHPGADGHRDLHVLDGARPAHDASRRDGEAPQGSSGPTSAAAILRPGELGHGPGCSEEGGSRGLDRRGTGLPDSVSPAASSTEGARSTRGRPAATERPPGGALLRGYRRPSRARGRDRGGRS